MDLEIFKQTILEQCFSSDNSVIQEANKKYNQFITTNFIDSISFFIQLMKDPTNVTISGTESTQTSEIEKSIGLRDIASVLFIKITRDFKGDPALAADIIPELFNILNTADTTVRFRNSVAYSINNLTPLIEDPNFVIQPYLELYKSENDDIAKSAITWSKSLIFSNNNFKEHEDQLKEVLSFLLNNESVSISRKVACCEILFYSSNFDEFGSEVYNLIESFENQEDICQFLEYIASTCNAKLLFENLANYLEFFVDIAKNSELEKKTRFFAIFSVAKLFELMKKEMYPSVIDVVSALVEISASADDYDPFGEFEIDNSFLSTCMNVIYEILMYYPRSAELYKNMLELIKGLFDGSRENGELLIATLELSEVFTAVFSDLSPPIDFINQVDYLLELVTHENSIIRYSVIKAIRSQVKNFKDSIFKETFDISSIVEKVIELADVEKVSLNKELCFDTINILNKLFKEEMKETHENQIEILMKIEDFDKDLVFKALKNMKFFVNNDLFIEKINEFAVGIIQMETQHEDVNLMALYLFTAILVKQNDEYIKENIENIYKAFSVISFERISGKNIKIIIKIILELMGRNVELIQPIIQPILAQVCEKISTPLKKHEFDISESLEKVRDYYCVENTKKNVLECYPIEEIDSFEESLKCLKIFIENGFVGEEEFQPIFEILLKNINLIEFEKISEPFISIILNIAIATESNNNDDEFVKMLLHCVMDDFCEPFYNFYKLYEPAVRRILERNPENEEFINSLTMAFIYKLVNTDKSLRCELEASIITNGELIDNVKEYKETANFIFKALNQLRDAQPEIFNTLFAKVVEMEELSLSFTEIGEQKFITKEVPQLFALFVIGNPEGCFTEPLFEFLGELIQIDEISAFKTIRILAGCEEVDLFGMIEPLIFENFSYDFSSCVPWTITYAYAILILRYRESQDVSNEVQFVEQAMNSSVAFYTRTPREEVSVIFLSYLFTHDNNPEPYILFYKEYISNLSDTNDKFSAELFSIFSPQEIEQ